VAEGLGSAWAGGFDEGAVGKTLAIDGGLQPVAILGLGYPAEIPEPTPRRKLRDIVTYK